MNVTSAMILYKYECRIQVHKASLDDFAAIQCSLPLALSSSTWLVALSVSYCACAHAPILGLPGIKVHESRKRLTENGK